MFLHWNESAIMSHFLKHVSYLAHSSKSCLGCLLSSNHLDVYVSHTLCCRLVQSSVLASCGAECCAVFLLVLGRIRRGPVLHAFLFFCWSKQFVAASLFKKGPTCGCFGESLSPSLPVFRGSILEWYLSEMLSLLRDFVRLCTGRIGMYGSPRL